MTSQPSMTRSGIPVLDPDASRRLLRIAMMAHEILHETRAVHLDEAARAHLGEMQTRALAELRSTLPEELRRELDMIAFADHPGASESELRVAQGQLVGWLEGLFEGMHASALAGFASAIAHMHEQVPHETGNAPGQYL